MSACIYSSMSTRLTAAGAVDSRQRWRRSGGVRVEGESRCGLGSRGSDHRQFALWPQHRPVAVSVLWRRSQSQPHTHQTWQVNDGVKSRVLSLNEGHTTTPQPTTTGHHHLYITAHTWRGALRSAALTVSTVLCYSLCTASKWRHKVVQFNGTVTLIENYFGTLSLF